MQLSNECRIVIAVNLTQVLKVKQAQRSLNEFV